MNAYQKRLREGMLSKRMAMEFVRICEILKPFDIEAQDRILKAVAIIMGIK